MLRIARRLLSPALLALSVVVASPGAVLAQTDIIAWGANFGGQCNVPPNPVGSSCLEVVGGGYHGLARYSDGTVLGWGWNTYGQCNAPVIPAGISIVELAAGTEHSLARLTDGTVIAWGENLFGQCSVPPIPTGITVIKVAAGAFHSIAVLSDGSVLTWGSNMYGQCTVPALPPNRSAVWVGGGYDCTFAMMDDGSLIGWGRNAYGECNVPPLPSGIQYVDVDLGGTGAVPHVVAMRSDGQVVAWGDNTYGQCNIPSPPIGVEYIEAEAGDAFTMLRCNDGSVVAWGYNGNGQCAIPALPSGRRISCLSSKADFTIAMLEDSTPWGYCVAKHNSAGCTPAIGWTGTPTSTGPVDNFYVTASSVLNRKPGIMIWSTQPGSTPLGGGTLCLAPPVIRTSSQLSGGSPAPIVDCTGQYSFHFGHAYIQSYFLTPGQAVRAQYWSRDPGFPAPNNIGLTNGLAFVIGP